MIIFFLLTAICLCVWFDLTSTYYEEGAAVTKKMRDCQRLNLLNKHRITLSDNISHDLSLATRYHRLSITAFLISVTMLALLIITLF